LFSIKTLYEFLFFTMRATHSANLILLDLIIIIILAEENAL
jgi:hypothetical protein